ncbi:Mediator of RNA polymerase II transcription subunit 9 [Nymphon striatum]|nr:Mediator of RNA polymerase II transcription subunit 9 [Nymphon striatum]
MASEDTKKAGDIDADFLPLIYDILRSVEKEVQDNNQKLKDSQDGNQNIQDLSAKFTSCREQIKKLPGLDFNEVNQLKYLENLKKQLDVKKKLLQKYRDMCNFDESKI